jgi:hypothetical protein
MRMILHRALRFALCGLALTCAGATARSGELPRNATVLAVITPGKPGAPSEEIEVRKVGTEVTLRVTRRAPGQPLQEQRHRIQVEDLRPVWEASLPLFGWSPRTIADAADFGERRLRLERSRGEGTPEVWEVAWTAPLTDDRAVSSLLGRLAGLAEHRSPELPLHYFPTPRR